MLLHADLTIRHDLICAPVPKQGLGFLELIETAYELQGTSAGNEASGMDWISFLEKI